MDKHKKISLFNVLFIFLLGLFFFFQASELRFDYEFENFFPKNNDQLEFFNKYRNEFENDNDYIFIALVNDEGIFKQDFLVKASNFSKELAELEYVKKVISPTEAKKATLKSGGLDMSQSPYLHIEEVENYSLDSISLRNSKDWIVNFIGWESNSICILLKNEEHLSKLKSDKLSDNLSDLIDKYNFDKVHYIGKITGQKVYLDVLKKEFLFFNIVTISILLVLLFFIYSSVLGIILPLITVLLTVIVSLGIMQLAGKQLNMLSILLPVIMLVVGMSDVIHFTSKYKEELYKGNAKLQAVKNTIRNVGFATFFTSVTTAIGFATLVVVSVPPVADFGIFTAIGVMAAFVISIVFVPSVLLLSKPLPQTQRRLLIDWNARLNLLFLLVMRKRKLILAVYLAAFLISLIGISKIEYNYFLMKDLPEDHSLMKDLRFFQHHYGGIRPFEMAIIVKEKGASVLDYQVMKEIRKVEEYLKNEYEVNQIVSPTSFFLYANRMMHQNSEVYFRFPPKEKTYIYLLKKLKESSFKNEFNKLISADGKTARISGKMVDPGSRQILIRNEAMKRFISQSINSELIECRLTGSTLLIDESSRYLSRNILGGLLIAIAIVGLIMALLFKSFKFAFVSLIPNILPLLFAAAVIGYLNMYLNMITALIFTVGFGIAVDDTIHFLSRYHLERKKGSSNLFALRRTFVSTGRAIIYTTIVLLGGFVSFIFSDFQSTSHIGIFVSLILLFALITDIFLLPLLLLNTKAKT